MPHGIKSRKSFFLKKATPTIWKQNCYCIYSYVYKVSHSIVSHAQHYSFIRSKYFYLLIAQIKGFISLNNEIDSKIDVTAMQFLLVQNRHQTHDWTLIGSGANGLGIQECKLGNRVKFGQMALLPWNFLSCKKNFSSIS